MNKTKGVYLSPKGLENLKIIIDYLLESEERHYEETISTDFGIDEFSKDFYNREDVNHIYAFTRRLMDEIDLHYER